MVWDYGRKRLMATAGADGVALISVPPVPDNELWFVDRMVAQCKSSTKTEALIYAGDVTDANIIDGSRSGNLDFADLATPHLIPGTVQMQAQWTGASVGAVARLYVQYTVLRRQDSV